MLFQKTVLAGAALLVAAVASAQSGTPAPQAPNAKRLAWWRGARFGMFIHWGPVSQTGEEIGWSRGDQVPIETYDNLYKTFNPTKFDADRWVKIAKAAGARYIVLTTKHHDGFCLFNTKQTDYNVMNTPFHRDVTKELADACKRNGIAFGAYHSVCDWHHPDFPYGSPGGSTKKPNPDFDRYEAYLKAEIAEIIHQYGPLATLWCDIPQAFDAARGQRVVDYVRGVQPDIVINDRCANPGDYDTPEQRIGKYQDNRPWESCITICQQWAWRPNDNMKSLQECVRTLAQCAGGDGNLLLNVGPQPNGEIEQRQVDRLMELGAWLQKHGQSIYGTRGGPFKPADWGCATHKGDTVYLHVFNWGDGTVRLPAIPAKIRSARVLTGAKATFTQTDAGITVSVASTDQEPMDTVVVLRLDRSAADIKAVP